MIIVLHDHGLKVLLPISLKAHTVVIVCFVTSPHIYKLVHNIYAQLVTGSKKRRRSRVMGYSKSIESRFFHLANLPVHHTVIGCSSNKPAVMVDAGTSELYSLAINSKAVYFVQ